MWSAGQTISELQSTMEAVLAVLVIASFALPIIAHQPQRAAAGVSTAARQLARSRCDHGAKVFAGKSRYCRAGQARPTATVTAAGQARA